MALMHSTCVEFNGKGVLISGPSGSGKSDLALRLMDAGGTLVSDDYVELKVENNQIVAHAAPNIQGMIEVRGVGLMKVDYKEHTTLALTLDLKERSIIDRLPDPDEFEFNGIKIPRYNFDAFAQSAVAKVRLLLR